MSVSSVLHVLGRLCLLFGGLLLLPLIMVALEERPDPAVTDAMIAAGALAVGLGLVLRLTFRKHVEDFDYEEAFAVTATSWMLFAFLGALPYWFSGVVPDLVDAGFESLSGLTTTGASILDDPAALGRPLLLWRALTHWVGGMGIIAMSLAVLPALGAGGNFLFQAETVAFGDDRLAPRIRDVARLLWTVYLGLTLLSVGVYAATGMGWFDAVCHAFATVATGGFGTRADSLTSFPAAVQWAAVVLMVLAGLNQVLLLAAVRGRPHDLLRSVESRTWVIVLLVATAVGVWTLHGAGASEGASVRDVALTVVSISSTTGFVGPDYQTWPVSLHVVLLLLMLGGACSGSTSGSAKMFRHLLWAKAGWRELQRMLRPTGLFPVKLQGRVIPEPVVTRAVAYLIFYLGCACLGVLLMTFMGQQADAALSGMVTCLSGVGPGLGDVGPTSHFGGLPDGCKWVLMGAMLLGRLEFFAVLVLFSPLVWRR